MNKAFLDHRIFYTLKIFIILISLSVKSFADDSNSIKNEITIGSNEALVKIKILSSLTCPHCANFHIKVLPEIKKKYVDTGKVQIIFIDFPLDQAAFNASKLLHCLEKKNQINFLDNIYENQHKWTAGANISDINNNLKEIFKKLESSDDKFDKCLIDEKISDKILNGRIEANQKYSINATPTIIINEKKLEGSTNFENIKKKIEKII